MNDNLNPSLPAGWADDRIRGVLSHYENQTPEAATSEDDAAYNDQSQTFMEVPTELVAEVRALIAKRRAG